MTTRRKLIAGGVATFSIVAAAAVFTSGTKPTTTVAPAPAASAVASISVAAPVSLQVPPAASAPLSSSTSVVAAAPASAAAPTFSFSLPARSPAGPTSALGFTTPPGQVSTNQLAQFRRAVGPGEYWEEGPGTNYVRMEGGALVDEDQVRTAREVVSHSTGTPEWTNPKGFEKDVFTFARVIFKSTVGYGQGHNYGRNLGWWVDFPDADLNFSYRLQQLTSAKVDPNGRVLKLTDPELHNYPLIYMEHAGYMMLREAEVEALRRYFAAGGVLLVGDFWSQIEWEGFERQMKRVLPDRKWVDVPVEHPIFHSVFNLKGPMQMLQVPTMQFWNREYDPRNPVVPLQTRDRGAGSETMHVRAWMDDKDRFQVFVIHNSDYSDGWEREGEHDDYFHTYSEKISYPLGINIVYYLMTH